MEKILVVDDSDVVRYVVNELLKEAGYDVVPANSKLTALDELLEEAGRFALVLTDLNMPGGNGDDLLKVMRYEGDMTPVVLMSGENLQERREKLLSMGFAAVVDKANTDELILVVKKTIEPTSD